MGRPNIKVVASLIITISLLSFLSLFQVVFATDSPDYEDQSLYITLKNNSSKNNLTPVQLSEEFFRISRDRVATFKTETNAITSPLSATKLSEIYNEMFNSDYINESADMVLSLESRNASCSLRALWFHMKTLIAGGNDTIIKKIVLEGFINHESIGFSWDFHVVTTAKANDDEWYVFDLEVGELLKFEEWLEKHIAYQYINRRTDRPYEFLLSIRPAKQYNMVDMVYDLNKTPAELKLFETQMFEYHPEVKAQFDKYMSNLEK